MDQFELEVTSAGERTLRGATLLIAGLLLVIAPLVELLVPLTAHGRHLARAMIASTLLGLVLTYLLLGLPRAASAAVHVFLGTLFAVPLASSCVLGGLDAPTLPLLTLVPMLATVVTSRLSALAWTSVLLATLAGLIGLERHGVQFDSVMMPSNRSFAVALIQTGIACAMVGTCLRHGSLNASLRGALSAERARYADLAGTDPLTGTANRRRFDEHLDLAMERAVRTKRGMGVILVDLDAFKRVNDQHGHAAGDAVLISAARRLQANTRRIDIVARLGGDELAIAVEAVHSGAELEAIAEKLVAELEQPVSFRGIEIPCRASWGVAQFPEDAQEVEGLLEHADFAMYRRKKARRPR